MGLSGKPELHCIEIANRVVCTVSPSIRGVTLMNSSIFRRSLSVCSLARRSGIFLLLVVMLSLSGCGSTKVYTANKTIVYDGDIYNMSTVQRIGSRVDGLLPGGDLINMRSLDKKEVEGLLKEHSSMIVTTIVEMDSQEMTYERRRITRYSDFSKMMKNFDKALDDVRKFMANKKSTQLKLK